MKKMGNNILGRRLAAMFIDGLIIIVLGVLTYLAVQAAQISMIVFFAAVALIVLIYPNLFEFSSLSATPGMLIMGLHLSFDDVNNVHTAHFLRSAWRLISCLPFGFGFWYCLADEEGKTVYDIKSSSHVVKMEKHSSTGKTPAVYVYNNNGKPEKYTLKKRTLIGRNPDICNIVFPSDAAAVSRCHCSITYNSQTNVFLLEDTGSSFGTHLSDGTMLQPGKIYVLFPNDVFFLGDTCNKIKVGFTEKNND